MEIKWHKTFSERDNLRSDDLLPWNVYQMSALENRFLIVDENKCSFTVGENKHSFTPTREQILDLAEKYPGWDQFLTFQNEGEEQNCLSAKVWNKDGGRAGNCGNGARCIAKLRMFDVPTKADMQPSEFIIEIESAKPVKTVCVAGYLKKVRSEFSAARVDAGDIVHKAIASSDDDDEWPTIKKMSGLKAVAQVTFGNPHLVLFFDSETALKQATPQGKKLEEALRHSPSEFYQNGVNISFAHIYSARGDIEKMGSEARGRIGIKTLERGANWTRSCGSGAAATYYTALEQNLLDMENLPKFSNPHGNFPLNPRHIALKPFGLEIDLNLEDGEFDRNAFRAVSGRNGEFYLIGNSQIERAGTLTL